MLFVLVTNIFFTIHVVNTDVDFYRDIPVNPQKLIRDIAAKLKLRAFSKNYLPFWLYWPWLRLPCQTLYMLSKANFGMRTKEAVFAVVDTWRKYCQTSYYQSKQHTKKRIYETKNKSQSDQGEQLCPAFVRRRPSTFLLKHLLLWNHSLDLTILHRNDAWVVPYQNCSNRPNWLQTNYCSWYIYSNHFSTPIKAKLVIKTRHS